ncbi:MAG: UDP-N-acetylglucosamine 1-carboxyvinyltransferase [Verrucomicrobia bacterium]|jgi:UDP-N-acetylglucosamine 1-carboxyvinyltransferase|nr:UDP-N-acetylglucosamine 1-carboxyvinyltransferase [Verrucomicrobiota bacterium]
MDLFRIEGGRQLRGSVQVGGAKNAALPIFAATLLTGETCRIRNVPDLSDIRFMARMLAHLGARVEKVDAHTYEIEAGEVHHRAPYELVRQMRASVCLLGPLVGRLRKAEISLPGGCVIGPRPIDLHLKGLRRLGCEVAVRNGYVEVEGAGLRGDYLYLGGRHGSTVTGTANMIMAAVLAPGTTRIESAACEPEIEDLCHFLRKMGARIEGLGSHYLKITGVDRLRGCDHSVLPDRIEAGTLILAGAITGGEITVREVIPGHMRALLDALESAEIPFESDPEQRLVRVLPQDKSRRPVEIITLPHPGFPTDLQAQMMAVMALTPGLSFFTERIYPNRFMHVPELLRMGADISMEGPSAVVRGSDRLFGAPVMASDLRASASLVLAGLAGEGTTYIRRIYHLDRGYEQLEIRLQQLGAVVERVDEEAIRDELGEW